MWPTLSKGVLLMTLPRPSGWYYKKPLPPKPCECVEQPVIDRDEDVSAGDIWICGECDQWWIVYKVERNRIISWRQFEPTDVNPGRNVF